MTPQEIRDAWNAQADKYNQWENLSEDEQLEWAVEVLKAQPAEPVATILYERGTPGKENDMPKVVSCNWLPDGLYNVYTAPPAQREPLTHIQAKVLVDKYGNDLLNLIFQTESAHGIGGKT